MFGFPIGNGNAGFNDFVEKFTNNADSGFPKIQQREVFYTIKDGNWNDITIWQTASGRVGIFPTANDDVYIRNVVTFNLSVTLTINNLFVSNRLNFNVSNGYIAIINTFNVHPNGLVDLTGAGANTGIYLQSNNNFCNKNCFIPSTNSTSIIFYSSFFEQNILDLNYHNLTIGIIGAISGTKYLTSNLSIAGNLFVGGILLGNEIVLECGQYNLIVNGTTTTQGKLSKAAEGNLLFIGNSGGKFELTGNPNVEFRGGLNIQNTIGASRLTLGNGIISFTTNNQTINGTGRTTDTTLWYEIQNVVIGDGITLTNSANTLAIFNYINGSDSLSKLVNNGVTLVFPTQASAENSMTTGIDDFTTFVNTIQYGGNYSATIPSYFTNFHNLTISGTGTKTLGVNTTLNGNLTLSTSGSLQCSTFDLTVTGTTTIGGGGLLSKNSTGNVLFTGLLNLNNNSGTSINFSGNPLVEVRGGISNGGSQNSQITSGTGQWTFSTNNQNVTNNDGIWTFNCPILISGAITLTIISTTRSISFYDTINGNNASSKLLNKGWIRLYNNVQPMATGIFDVTSFANTVGYWYSGSQNIPTTSYWSLEVGTATYTKTLSGNTTLSGNLIINSGILECSTYNLTISGTSTIGSGTSTTKLSKNGSGNILFTGLLTLSNVGGQSIDFSSGNPTIELRGGITNGGGNSSQIISGTGTWTFSTNNQNITNNDGQWSLDCPILISGAVTISLQSNTTSLILNNTLNGNNASSNFTNRGSLNYKSATQPMATGILDTSTNLNTWIYGLNNQDIKGSPTTSPKQVYRNLTLNGTGVKTLQGYVSVLNTYTLTAPATLALNGFTLTNP